MEVGLRCVEQPTNPYLALFGQDLGLIEPYRPYRLSPNRPRTLRLAKKDRVGHCDLHYSTVALDNVRRAEEARFKK